MLKYLIVASVVASSLAGVLPGLPKNLERIVGGEDADIKDAPWTAALLLAVTDGSMYLMCAASIISSSVILSSAACALPGQSPSIWRARAGSTECYSGGQLVGIRKYINHEGFGSGVNRYDNDIAIYLTSTPFVMDGVTVAALRLPNQDQAIADGTMGLITGWGTIGETLPPSETLIKAAIPVVNQKKCFDAYGSNWITPRMLCLGYLDVGGVDACSGDAGGPCAADGVLIGTSSWGNGCARPGYPGVWARTASFRDWIDKKMAENV